MTEEEFALLKRRVLGEIEAAPRDRNGYVRYSDEGEPPEMGRALSELNEEGRFSDYRGYIGGHWLIKPRAKGVR